MDEVKRDLTLIAKNIREGRRNRVPMGLLFTGPMGTGKTFVAEAFAKESGLTAIKLKNFRSKWVGATEGNLERILQVIIDLSKPLTEQEAKAQQERAARGEPPLRRRADLLQIAGLGERRLQRLLPFLIPLP